MGTNQRDLVVIGGGPAGYLAAIKAARLGASVTLVEKSEVGGTCLNRGCIPTKYYSQNAHILSQISLAASRGIAIKDPSTLIDMKKVLSGKERTVRKLTGGIKALLKQANVTIINQRGKITKEGVVLLDDGTLIEAKRIILATGSKSARIPVEGIDSPLVLDSDTLLELDYIPKRLAIIGGGVIGVEFASIFNAFGSEITLIESENRILPMFDKQGSDAVAKSLTKNGVNIETSVAVTSIETLKDEVKLTLAQDKSIRADLVLLAVGRKADLGAVESDGVLAIERARVVTDDYGMTSMSHIYAAGDVTGRNLLAHAAYQMGESVAHNVCVDLGLITSEKMKFSLDTVPSVVYSIPELSLVGLTEEEAKLTHNIVVGVFPLSANGRALSGGESDGFVKIVADKKYGQILGVCCVGMSASEIINEAALAMEHELTVHEVAHTIHAHPTISEAFKEAAALCIGECYHMV